MDNHPSTPVNLPRLLVKGVLLYLLFNLAVIAINPMPAIAKVSAYNGILPGRARLPYGDRPDLAYNLSLFSLEAMIASHEIAGANKASNEYRVILLGDSSAWGFLLHPDATLTAQLNSAGLTTTNGKLVRVYNLGYPTMSLTKDLFILSQVMKYQPDLIIWMFTLESFPDSKQLDSPIVQNNPEAIKALILAHHLDIETKDERLINPSFWNKSLIGQRRAIADITRLQFYGVLWAATGIDQYYPDKYEPPQSDLVADLSFHDIAPTTLSGSDLALETLEAGITIASGTPILFVNEPIYISQGNHSDIRYNFFYPKWAYDQYRTLMVNLAQVKGWNYLDVWNLIPPGEFTNSAIHVSPQGEDLLAKKVGAAILEIANP